MVPLEILVSGAGIAGCGLASFLLLSPLPANEKPHITIVERAPSMRAQGQNIDIRGLGLDIIRMLGLETAVRSSTTGEEGARLVDKDNAIWAEMAADKTGKVQTGTSDIEVLRGTLAAILYRRCKNISDSVRKNGGAGVDFIFGDHVDSIDQDGAQVHIHLAKSNQRKTFDYVIGADGLQSATRKLVWGEDGERERLHSLNAYGAFWSQPAAPTDSEWRRWFRAPGRKSIMTRPSGDPATTTIFMAVVSETDPRLPEAATWGHAGVAKQKALMRDIFQHEGWECPRILDAMDATADFYYDEIAQVHMPGRVWHKGRVGLVGDAAYCASPFSGMGTTIGLAGAYDLAGALFQHPADPEAAFTQYEGSMAPLVEKAQKLAPGMPKLLLPETGWGLWCFYRIVYAIWWTNLAYWMAKFKGPPARAVEAKEYGFERLGEWEGWREG